MNPRNARLIKVFEGLVRKQNLTQREIFFILSHEVVENNRLINIEFFNNWRLGKFSKRKFTDPINLENLEFRNKNLTGIDLRYATIRNTKFYACKLSNSHLWESHFICVKIWGARVDNANLRDSNFENSFLDELTSSSHLCLLESRFSNCRISFKDIEGVVIDLTGSTLKDCLITIPTASGGGTFSTVNPIGLDGNKVCGQNDVYELILNNCALERVRIANLKVHAFSGQFLVMTNSDFINLCVERFKNIDGIVLMDTRMPSNFFDPFLEPATEDKINELRTIRDNFKKIGNASSARKFFIASKDIEAGICRKSLPDFLQKSKDVLRYFLLRGAKEISEYGESPEKIFVFSLDIIIYSAIVNCLLGLTKTPTMFGNLYLSAITFATVGYGDYYPTCPAGKVVLGSVGIAGVFLMALFVVSLTKRIIEE